MPLILAGSSQIGHQSTKGSSDFRQLSLYIGKVVSKGPLGIDDDSKIFHLTAQANSTIPDRNAREENRLDTAMKDDRLRFLLRYT